MVSNANVWNWGVLVHIKPHIPPGPLGRLSYLLSRSVSWLDSGRTWIEGMVHSAALDGLAEGV